MTSKDIDTRQLIFTQQQFCYYVCIIYLLWIDIVHNRSKQAIIKNRQQLIKLILD